MANTAEELLLKISGDSQGGQQAIQNVVGSMDTLKGHAETLAQLLEKAFTDPGAAVEQLGTSVEGVTTEAFGGFADMLSGPVLAGVVGAAAAVAVLGPALFELGQHATESADELDHLSKSAQISVPALADLKFAFETAGGSLERVTGLMFTLDQRLENTPDKVATGLKMIGLSIEYVEQLQGDQKILAISDAMRHASDDTNLAAAAMDIFGRQGKDALPELLEPLSELAAKSKELGGFTQEAAEKANEFAIAHKSMALETERAWTELGLAVAPVTNTISLGWERMKLALANVVLTVDDIVTAFGIFSDVTVPKVASSLKGIIDPDDPTGGPMGLAAKQLKDWKDGVADMAATAPSLEEALRTDKEATKDLTEQLKEAHKQEEARKRDKELFDKALRDVIDSEKGYKQILDDISDDTVQAVFYDLQHHAAISDLATVYGLTTTQVQILAQTQKEYQKDEADQLKLFSDLHEQTYKLAQQHEKDWRKAQDDELKAMNTAILDTYNATRGYTDDYYDHVNKRSLDSEQYQIQKIEEWKEDQLGKFHGSEQQWQAYYDAVNADAAIKIQEIREKHSALFQDIKGFLADMTGEDGKSGWGKHFADVIFEGGTWKDKMVALWDGGDESIRGQLKKILEKMAEDFITLYIAKASSALAGWLSGLGGGGGGGLLGFLAGLIPGLGGHDPGSSTPITGGYFDPTTGEWVPTPAGGGSPGSGPQPPDVDNPHPHESLGGIIPAYFARGGFPGYPIGTDTVPTWLTPGEGVLNPRAMARLGTENFTKLNAGVSVRDVAGGGARPIVQNFYIDGNVWALQDLSRAVAQQLADEFMQAGGGLPVDH